MEQTREVQKPTTVAPVVERNIRTLLAERTKEEARLGWQEKLGAGISRFTGSLSFVALHVVLFGLWITINLGAIPAVPRFDATLVKLAVAVSIEAIFLSTFILMTQHRMMVQAERRAHLHLQISLLAEHEITRLMTVTREMATHMGIEVPHEPEFQELEQDLAPEEVLQRMDEHERKLRDGS